MKKYPYTIDNGHGERLTFTGISNGPTGERAEAEGIAQPGAGPPMHVHHLQDEVIQVISGRLGYQTLNGPEQFAGPGELVVWPAGTAHRWWNAGSGELHSTGWWQPPDNVEFFLGAIFESARENGGRPGAFDAAFLTTRYRTEFEMVEIPLVVRRLVMPILYGVGKILGKHRKYTDAPPPITRDRRPASSA